MKLKTMDVTVDGKTLTVAVLDEKGHPVYVHDDGKEVGHDAALATSKITALNAEAKQHREAKEAAEAKLKGFEGIEDADAARQAIQTVANLNSGDLKTAAQVQEIKDAATKAAAEQVAAAKKALEDQLAAVSAERDKVTQQFHAELIGGGFSRSKFITEKIAVPVGMMQATFGQHFKIEDGKVVAYDGNGQKIISRTRPGDFADFEEAIEALVESYPHKDHILKGQIPGGGGAQQPNGGGGGKSMKRAEFDRLDPVTQGKTIKDGIKIVD